MNPQTSKIIKNYDRIILPTLLYSKFRFDGVYRNKTESVLDLCHGKSVCNYKYREAP